MDECIDKNMIDKDEYPQTAEVEARCVHMLADLSSAEGFENCAGDGEYIPRPEERPLTKFEQRGIDRGHGVWDLLFRRVQ